MKNIFCLDLTIIYLLSMRRMKYDCIKRIISNKKSAYCGRDYAHQFQYEPRKSCAVRICKNIEI